MPWADAVISHSGRWGEGWKIMRLVTMQSLHAKQETPRWPNRDLHDCKLPVWPKPRLVFRQDANSTTYGHDKSFAKTLFVSSLTFGDRVVNIWNRLSEDLAIMRTWLPVSRHGIETEMRCVWCEALGSNFGKFFIVHPTIPDLNCERSEPVIPLAVRAICSILFFAFFSETHWIRFEKVDT